jgi:hypothetical protein
LEENSKGQQQTTTTTITTENCQVNQIVKCYQSLNKVSINDFPHILADFTMNINSQLYLFLVALALF